MHEALERREFLGAGVAALALTAAGCATDGVSDAFTWDLRTRAAAAGMKPDFNLDLRQAVQRHVDNHDHTGVVSAVARNNKLVWYEAQGVRDVETNAPMRRDDIFRMMSSTKNITSTAVLLMMEAGKLSIDDPVSRYIPSFARQRVAIGPQGWQQAITDPGKRAELAAQVRFEPAVRDITIKDLLTHTSGLSSTFGLGAGPASLVNPDLHTNFATDTLANRIPQLGAFALDFQPGSRWGYSPLDGMDTLLHIVELTSDQDAESFLQKRIFDPLGMIDTHFNLPAAKQARLLKLYERKDDAWREAPAMFGNAPVKYICGAGGLMSTVHDYLQFELMRLNGGVFNGARILREDTVTLMSTNHVGALFAQWAPPLTDGMGFGLGVRVVVDPTRAHDSRGRGAFGWGGAYGTESWTDPALGIAACYFVQQPGNLAVRDFEHEIAASIA
ncbi:MAG: serine hydrolase domain-containing protein [Terricaulis sp.]